MDADLYDEFGNYIGPDLESEDEDDEDQDNFTQSETQPDYDVSFCFHILFILNNRSFLTSIMLTIEMNNSQPLLVMVVCVACF